MQRKTKLFIFSSLILILSISIFMIFHNFFKGNITIINNTLFASSLPDNSFKSTYISKTEFSNRPVIKISGINLNILNESNISNVPMLLKSQRYYIPLDFICTKLNYTISTSDNSILLSNNENKIKLSKDSYTKNSCTGSLRGKLINNDNTNYISISDIEQLFNLIAVFDFKNNSISLLNNDVKGPEDSSITYTDKIALIRLEDFTCGFTNVVDRNQTKVKCMVNLLYSQGLKFHVSWIPRFVSPPDNIDNDLLTNDNIANVGFVNLLDYIINKGGEIGLHGYTHQHGNEVSAVGADMSEDINNTIPETEAVIEKGLDTASALNIPISYFESSHYRGTKLQRSVIEKYFQFLYDPFDYEHQNIYSPDDQHLYIPAPFYGVEDSGDSSRIVNGLNNDNQDTLHSFYYHPSIELNYMDFNTNGNKVNATFNENSPLKQIVEALKSNEYTTLCVDEFKPK